MLPKGCATSVEGRFEAFVASSLLNLAGDVVHPNGDWAVPCPPQWDITYGPVIRVQSPQGPYIRSDRGMLKRVLHRLPRTPLRTLCSAHPEPTPMRSQLTRRWLPAWAEEE